MRLLMPTAILDPRVIHSAYRLTGTCRYEHVASARAENTEI